MKSVTTLQENAPLFQSTNSTPPISATVAEKDQRKRSLSLSSSSQLSKPTSAKQILLNDTSKKADVVASTVQAEQATSQKSPAPLLTSSKTKTSTSLFQKAKSLMSFSSETLESKRAREKKEQKKALQAQEKRDLEEFQQKIVYKLLHSINKFMTNDMNFVTTNPEMTVVGRYNNAPQDKQLFLDNIITLMANFSTALNAMKLNPKLYCTDVHVKCEMFVAWLISNKTFSVLQKLKDDTSHTKKTSKSSTQDEKEALDPANNVSAQKIEKIFNGRRQLRQLNTEAKTLALPSSKKSSKPKRVDVQDKSNSSGQHILYAQKTVSQLSLRDTDLFKEKQAKLDALAEDITDSEVSHVESNDGDVTDEEISDGEGDFDVPADLREERKSQNLVIADPSSKSKQKFTIAKRALSTLRQAIPSKGPSIFKKVAVLDNHGKVTTSQTSSKSKAPNSTLTQNDAKHATRLQQLLEKAQTQSKERFVSRIFTDGCINKTLLATIALGASMLFAGSISMAMK